MSAWESFKLTLAGVLGDKGAALPAIVGVIFYCFFYPLPYLPQTVRQVPVAVADYDASPLSRQFERDLDTTRQLHVTQVVRSVQEAVPLLHRLEIGGIVAIPPDFDRDVLRGTPTGVTVLGDGGYVVVDGTILETASEVLAATAAGPVATHLLESQVPPAALLRAARAGPVVIKQPLFNTVQGYESYVVPASTGIIVHQLLLIAICIVIGTWTEKGPWAIAPGGVLTLRGFGALIGALSLLVWCALIFWIGFVFWFHDLPRGANLVGAIEFCGLYAVAISALGVSVGCWMGERERALQVVAALSVPLLFMSGFAFPIESMPQPVVELAYLLPSTHGIQGLLKFNQMGASWREAQPEVLGLVVLILLYCVLGWLLARWRARGGRALRPALADRQK